MILCLLSHHLYAEGFLIAEPVFKVLKLITEYFFWEQNALLNIISLQLGKHKEALDFAVASHSLAPSKSEVAERVENVKKDIVLGMDKMVMI